MNFIHRVITSANYNHSSHGAPKRERQPDEPRPSLKKTSSSSTNGLNRHKASLSSPPLGTHSRKSLSTSPPPASKWDIDTALANANAALRLNSATGFGPGHSASMGRDVHTYKPYASTPTQARSPYPVPFKRHASFGDARHNNMASSQIISTPAPIPDTPATSSWPIQTAGSSAAYWSPQAMTPSLSSSSSVGSGFSMSNDVSSNEMSQRTPISASMSSSVPRSGFGSYLNSLHPVLAGLEKAFTNAGVKDQQTLLTLERGELEALVDTFPPDEANCLQKTIMKHRIGQGLAELA